MHLFICKTLPVSCHPSPPQLLLSSCIQHPDPATIGTSSKVFNKPQYMKSYVAQLLTYDCPPPALLTSSIVSHCRTKHLPPPFGSPPQHSSPPLYPCKSVRKRVETPCLTYLVLNNHKCGILLMTQLFANANSL